MPKQNRTISIKVSGKKFFASCMVLFSSLLFNLATAALPAGPVLVKAIPDTNHIRIGEQLSISLKAEVPTGVLLNFPLFPDTLNGLEIIKRSPIDTILSADKSSSILSQTLLATCFDSGYYAIAPFHFTSLNPETGNTDTFSTEAFLISVSSVPVDTTQAIKDIKATISVPLTWKEILAIGGGVLLALLILFLIIRFLRKRKPEIKPVPAPVPTRPAYELALEALRKVEKEKLWQQGYFKSYHSSVSDILREYIERSFDINALELTSDETLERIRRNRNPLHETDKLASVLHTADLVKFAKLVPLPDENERSLRYAYDFVNGTRPLTENDLQRKEDPI